MLASLPVTSGRRCCRLQENILFAKGEALLSLGRLRGLLQGLGQTGGGSRRRRLPLGKALAVWWPKHIRDNLLLRPSVTRPIDAKHATDM